MATGGSNKDNSNSDFTCFFCDVVTEYTNESAVFIANLSELLIAPMLVIFGAIIPIWLLVHAYKIVLGTGNFSQLAQELIFVILALLLLGSQGAGLIRDVFETSYYFLGVFGSLPFAAIDPGALESVAGDYEGLALLIAFGEEGIGGVFDVADTLVGKSSWGAKITALAFATALVLPYFVLSVAFSAQVLIAIFRIMLVSAFSPFLVMAFGFGWGREMFYRGISLIISSIGIIFACSTALGIILAAVNGLAESLVGLETLDNASFSEPQFIVPMLLGWVGVAFMAEATSIANSITGTNLNNQGAMIITGGALWAAKQSMKLPGMGADAAAKTISGSRKALDLIEKFKRGK